MRRYTCRWASESAGNQLSPWFDIAGKVCRLETRPNPDFAPSANYDVTLETANGEDLLQGMGANRSASAAEHATIYVASTDGFRYATFTGKVRLRIVNAGAYKAGIVAVVILES